MTSFTTKSACWRTALSNSLSVVYIIWTVLSGEIVLIIKVILVVEVVLIVPIVKLVLIVPVCLCELIVLIVPINWYYLAVSTFCCIMTLSLIKGTELDPVGWCCLSPPIFSAHHHGMTRDATVSTLLGLCAHLSLWCHCYILRLIHPRIRLDICWTVH